MGRSEINPLFYFFDYALVNKRGGTQLLATMNNPVTHHRNRRLLLLSVLQNLLYDS